MKKDEVTLKAGPRPVVPRAGGGVIIPRAAGGVVILRAAAPMVPRSGRRYVAGGWHPDVPDFRDFGLDRAEFREPLEKAKALLGMAPAAKLQNQVDNRHYCSPVEDQETLGSCTAHAVVGMLEYMMRRGLGEHTDLSRLFLYKVTRRLLGWTGDTGAHIRTTIKAAVAFGTPPEEHCPYDVDRYDEEPEAFLYSYADNFKALNYARLDLYNASGQQTLDALKRTLGARLVVAFGFPVYSSMTESPYVPYPTLKDKLQGGHAVLAVGYDDNVVIEDGAGNKTKEGCLIFRNSWGADWGENGYGYLPYKYVENALAVDFWTVFRSEWLKEGQFS
jgi:C1A family cysteine protease